MFRITFDGYGVTIDEDQSGLWRSIVDMPSGLQVREWRRSFDDAYERATELIRANRNAAAQHGAGEGAIKVAVWRPYPGTEDAGPERSESTRLNSSH